MNSMVEINSSMDNSEVLDGAELITKFLTVKIAGQLYAIPCNHVVEILGVQKITYMPHAPKYVKGVTNIRGKIIPLVELGMRFGKDAIVYDDRTCVVITEIDDTSVGYIVEEVCSMSDILKEELSEAPRIADASAKYIQGVAKMEDNMALILDLAKLNIVDVLHDIEQ